MPTNITDTSAFTDPIQGVADADAQAAASYNLGFQGLANRTRFLKNEIGAPRTFPTAVDVYRTLGLASGQELAGAWEWVFVGGAGYVWRSLADGGELWVPINPSVSAVSLDGATTFDNVYIKDVSVFWKPGASRTGTNRMLVSLISQAVSGGALATTLHASANGDASTTSWHTTTLTPPSPILMSHLGDYNVAINAGNDGSTSKDLVGRIILHTSANREAV